MPTIDPKITWPGWETVRLIGRGSFGAVYEIQREVLGHQEKAALKYIRIPQSESELDELMNDGYDAESITARFRGYLQDIVREYSLMADMKGCGNVVYSDDVRYIQHDNGMGWDIYIKMELLTPLPKTMGKMITEPQVVKIGKDICNALTFCEKRNLIHRDIKPANIFMAADGTYKLGDFGIAKTAERTTSGTKTGTYKYMAPEVYNNQPYGTKADIYSLGLVLYWLLNERRMPFLPLGGAIPTSRDEDDARNRRLRGEQIPPPAHGSAALKQIVLKACAYSPRDRYQSAAEMLRDLEAVELGQPIGANRVFFEAPMQTGTPDREGLAGSRQGQSASVPAEENSVYGAQTGSLLGSLSGSGTGLYDAAPAAPGSVRPAPTAEPEETVGAFGAGSALGRAPAWGGAANAGRYGAPLQSDRQEELTYRTPAPKSFAREAPAPKGAKRNGGLIAALVLTGMLAVSTRYWRGNAAMIRYPPFSASALYASCTRLSARTAFTCSRESPRIVGSQETACAIFASAARR